MFNRIWAWLRHLFSKSRPAGIFVVFSSEEIELLACWAQRQGLTVESFIRDSTLNAVPAADRKKFSVRDQIGLALDTGFSMLEKEDEMGGLVLPLPDRKKLALVEHLPRQTPKNHTCGFLSETFPGTHNSSTSFGVCTNPTQEGRPCFWPSGVAHECPIFKSFRASRSA